MVLEQTIPPLQRKVLEQILKTYRIISQTTVDILLDQIQTSGDFPDEELADKIQKSEMNFRRDFNLRSL